MKLARLFTLAAGISLFQGTPQSLLAQEKASSHPVIKGDAEFVVACEGKYSGHVQGVCLDEDCNIYWSWTTAIVKTDGRGKILKKVEAPTHQGDLCYVDGFIYVAVNLGKFNRPAGEADSWVYQYDAKTLELVNKFEVQEAVHGAGGMEYVDGHFFVVGGLPKDGDRNFVYEYDKNFKFQKRHEILSGWTKLGIQTAFFKDNHWWFGCYGDPEVMIKTNKEFGDVKVYQINVALGIASGGVGEREFLLAKNKKDAQKMYEGKLVVKKLDEETLTKLFVR